MARADKTAPKQTVGVPFQPGKSGNPAGRPKGSRNKLGEAFIADMVTDWEQHGADVIAAVREANPVAYLKVVASVVPQQVDLNAEHSLRSMHDISDAELIAVIQDTAAAVGLSVAAMTDDFEQEARH